VIHLESRIVERWVPTDEKPTTIDEFLAWQPRPDLPPLEIDLIGYFREVWDEPI
jgi:hypothetical protein